METYEAGSHIYHTTMPTDALTICLGAMQETRAAGFAALRERQRTGPARARAAGRARLPERGSARLRGTGRRQLHHRPGHAVGQGLHRPGLQTASGVPLQCDEPADFRTFRVGLFGLDKLGAIDRTVEALAQALDRVGAQG